MSALRRAGAGLAGAAVLIGVVTATARAVGFSRSWVLSQTVGNGCLNTAYNTANQVPNIVFEVVAGGALAGAVVPVLAGAVERGDREHVARTVSALLTWVIVVLTPFAALVAVASGPLMDLLVGTPRGCDAGEVVAVAVRMLRVFAPQIVLYGVAVVLYGLLQSQRRFLAPALAPLLSSLVVIGAYLVFVPLAGAAAYQGDLTRLPETAELTLSIGTTAGAVALVLTALVPALRTRVPLRPSFTFPPGVAGRVRALATAGIATLLAQQASVVVVLVLANDRGGAGALGLYNYAWQIFLLPWAVLAVPIATSAFTHLSGRHSAGDRDAFDATAAATTRAVVLVCCLAAAVVAATATPVARFFVLGTPGDPDPAVLARALVAFAPGLIGYGLVAHLGRTLMATGRAGEAAVATVAGWAVVIVADVAIALSVPPHWTVPALGLGNTIGMTAAGVLLLFAVRRARGREALAGLRRALLAGALAMAAGYLAGTAVEALAGEAGRFGSLGVAAGAAAAALAGFAVVALPLAGRDLRAVLRRGRTTRREPDEDSAGNKEEGA
ncbi:MAG: virulence factor MviN [Streptosporangiales bacterium]|nr:virulence factor MviN [Streptosporangiales bacterium]